MTVPIEEPGAVEKKVVSGLVKAFLFHRLKGPSYEPPTHLGARPFTLRASDGTRLAATHYPAPHGHPRGLVILAHPHKRYAQHWFAREGWIDWLHAAGYAAVTFDFSRYGRSRRGSTYLHEQLISLARHARAFARGAPMHVIGVSVGSFAAANAAPRLDFVESLTLESPYPHFEDWYAHADAPAGIQRTNRAFARLFPTTYRRISAERNLAQAPAARILVTAMADDTVTATQLSRRVAAAGPRGRTRYLELDGPAHLEAFRTEPAYRAALLSHLGGQAVGIAAERLAHEVGAGVAVPVPQRAPSARPTGG